MKTTKLALCTGALTLAMTLPTIAPADEVVCPPNLGNVTIDGNVSVVAACRLDGTTVKGNVHLYAGGSLIARNANIDGNIQSDDDGIDYIDVDESSIGGSVQLENMRGDLSIVRRSSIGGSIQLKSNASRIEVRNNNVDADVQAFGNNGLIVISENTIDGNLQCKENSPPPAGGNNVVRGNKEDQCANLQPEAGISDPNGVDAQTTGNAVAAASGNGGLGAFGPLSLLWMLLGTPLLLSLRRL